MNYPAESHLNLELICNKAQRTVIDTLFFTPPFKIIDTTGESMHADIMLLNVGAGLLSGDVQHININLKHNTSATLSTQSFEKIHTGSEGTQRYMQINLAANSRFFYLPLPSIPFRDSSYCASTSINMENNAKLYFAEILAAGRVAKGEIFAFTSWQSFMRLYCGESLIYAENTILEPHHTDLSTPFFFHSFTHWLNLIIIDDSFQPDNLTAWIESKDVLASMTKLHQKGYCLKALAHESEKLLEFCFEFLHKATNICIK